MKRTGLARKRRQAIWLFTALLLCIFLLLTGCGPNPTPPPASNPPYGEATAQTTMASGSSAAATTTTSTTVLTTTTTTQPPTTQPPAPPTKPLPPAPTAVEAKVNASTARLHGRTVNDGDKLVLEWTNTGFSMRFQGTGVKIRLSSDKSLSAVWPFVRFFVDGREMGTYPVDEMLDFSVAEGLPYGEHTLQVVRLSEALTVSPVRVESVTFISEAEEEAVLLPPAAAAQRKIEFIGDSMTCGFGNKGKPFAETGEAGKFYTSQQDGLKTYAAFTATYFGADAHYIAASGKGVVHNYGRDTTLLIPELFLKQSPTAGSQWDFGRWKPDVVVINAGTNDYKGGTTKEQMRTGVLSFLDVVHSRYPDAPIIWMYGTMSQEFRQTIEETVAAYNEGKGTEIAHLLVTPKMTSYSQQGTLGHPNVQTHERDAQALIRKIASLTGWGKAVS